jgi:hypothetical protein
MTDRFTPEEFQTFQSEFTKWQNSFGLNGYKVYFKHEPSDDSFADISIAQDEMCATARLNSKLPEKDIPHADVEASAKHEAIHLLLGRLEERGRDRYIRADEIYEATEELVRRLEHLIP